MHASADGFSTGLRPILTTRPVTAQGGPWPLHDTAATRALEAAAQADAPTPPLMARAGLAVARLARALAPNATRTLVFAGPGNNGGDGVVAARLLHNARHPVAVRLAADPRRLPPDAAQALRMAASAGVDVQPFRADETWLLGAQDCAIDALLGIGSRRAPTGAVAEAIAAWQGLRAVTLAVDLPSGLHPDTGALLGSQAVRAQATLGLLTLKPGCFTAQGRDHVGQVWWDALGMAQEGLHTHASAMLLAPSDPGPRWHAAHKGAFGDVWVLGGDSGMAGALQLAAQAALAAGAGRVYACPLQPGSGAGAGLSSQPELMQRSPAQALQTVLTQPVTVVAGCGGGSAIEAALPQLLTHAARLVLDADGLNAVAARHGLQAALRRRAAAGLATVLTPHPLEAARLLACASTQVQADRLAAAQQLAEMFQAVVVLKGSGTVVAAPGRLPCVNLTGNAALGTAGTGDVLAGWIGGLWSAMATGSDSGRRGGFEGGAASGSHSVSASSDGVASAMAAACQSVWRHGQAADRWLAAGHRGPLLASALCRAMADG